MFYAIHNLHSFYGLFLHVIRILSYHWNPLTAKISDIFVECWDLTKDSLFSLLVVFFSSQLDFREAMSKKVWFPNWNCEGPDCWNTVWPRIAPKNHPWRKLILSARQSHPWRIFIMSAISPKTLSSAFSRRVARPALKSSSRAILISRTRRSGMQEKLTKRRRSRLFWADPAFGWWSSAILSLALSQHSTISSVGVLSKQETAHAPIPQTLLEAVKTNGHMSPWHKRLSNRHGLGATTLELLRV